MKSIRRYVKDAVEAVKRDYDTIDVILTVLVATIIEDLTEHYDSEYSEAYAEVLSGTDPDSSEAIFAAIGGKNFEERVREYVEELYLVSDLDDAAEKLQTKLDNMIEIDTHRIRCDAKQAAGMELSSVGFTVTKTWRSVKIPTTRDTHFELDGTTIPIDAYFQTVNGRALHPGGFGIPEEDCNCLCDIIVNVEE